ncbi:uncharacterized protein [Miscanthus floridulus]|uniref:uncharacterized protein n=1 Tax=Miscanthus floridulus TaxID=154761 RepID=UPI003459E3BA
MDRSWIKSRMSSREHVNGVNEFMTFVSERFSDDEEMFCPCHQCLNRVRRPKGQVQDHLYIHGMATTYTRWVHHGEPSEVVPHEIDDHVDEHTSLNEDFGMNVDEEDDPDDGIRGMVEELYTAEVEGRCINKNHVSRHVGRDLDNISRGLSNKIPVHIAEGHLQPEEPLQAAKLASEAGIILRNHVPIFTHWKHYKKVEAEGVVKNFNDKVGSQFTIDANAGPVKDAFSDLLKKGQRQMRYRPKKQYFNGIPANEVRTTSPLTTITDMEWKQLVDMWSTPKHKEKCLKNKDSRELVQYHQMT